METMAFALHPVFNVGIQILLNIAIGWLLVASHAVDGDKYMPQVHIHTHTPTHTHTHTHTHRSRSVHVYRS